MAETHSLAFGLPADLIKPLGISATRTHILAFVARTGPSTAVQMMAEVGIGRSTLAEHLAALESGGLLVSSPDPERPDTGGSGANRLVWTADVGAIRDMFGELSRQVLGKAEHHQK